MYGRDQHDILQLKVNFFFLRKPRQNIYIHIYVYYNIYYYIYVFYINSDCH